eukprot:snap_masked-scaffold_23-processed-gene-1.15-mRNA-1 protein AED:0.41 eAED:0.44 QI:0/-1/0/1/-1/1/1/0/409
MDCCSCLYSYFFPSQEYPQHRLNKQQSEELEAPLLRARVSHKDSFTGEYGPLMTYHETPNYSTSSFSNISPRIDLSTTDGQDSDFADDESQTSTELIARKKNSLNINLNGIKIEKGTVIKKVEKFEKKTKGKRFIDLYSLGKKVGEGSTSQVYICKNKQKEIYAVKVISKNNMFGNKLLEQFKQEIDILDKLRHKNIIRIYGMFESTKAIHIVTEYSSGGDMFNFLLKEPGNRLKEIYVKNIIKQLISAVLYMHKKDIIHRDLKLENILLARKEQKYEKMEIKIVDFGLAKAKQLKSRAKTFFGTLGYLAPEMFTNKIYNNKIDIWSTGIITFILGNGEFPFSQKTQISMQKLKNKNLNLLERKLQNKYKLNFSSNLSKDYKNFVTCLLKVIPNKRISALEASKHSFLC